MNDLKPMMDRRKSISPMDRALSAAFLAGGLLGAIVGGATATWLTLVFIKATGG